MAFPNSIDAATPGGTDSPVLGDNQIRDLKTFIEDVLGIADATSITAGGLTYQTNGRLTALTRWSLREGAAIASAAALTPGTDGNLFHITGTTGMTSIASIDGAGPIWLVYDDAVIITHNATSLIMLGGTNYTTVAGDVLCFMHEGSGNWRELYRGVVRSGAVTSAQIIRKTAQTQVVNNSTTLVNDDALLAPLAANETIYFICHFFHTGNTTADFKFTFTAPAGVTAIKWSYAGGSNFASDSAGNWASAGGPVTTSGGGPDDLGGATGGQSCTVIGIVRNGSTAGNWQMQWAQQTATAVDTFVQTDSFMIVFRV